MSEIFALLGLAAPFGAAATLYAVFVVLDDKMSASANSIVARWIKGEDYKRYDLASAVVVAFDGLYGSPLLTLRSFRRSAVLSLCAFLVFFLFEGAFIERRMTSDHSFMTTLGTFLLTFSAFPAIIISDYLSLFVVRECLKMFRSNTAISVLVAALAGVFIVSFCAYLILIENLVFIDLVSVYGMRSFRELVFEAFRSFVDAFGPNELGADLFLRFAIPAIFVHLWLPLMVVGAIVHRLLIPFFQFVTTAQWLIKDNEQHPMQAIGVMACGVVFLAGTLLQISRYILQDWQHLFSATQ